MFFVLTVTVHIPYEAMIHDSPSSVRHRFSLSLCWSLWDLHLTAGRSGYCIRHQTLPTAENLRNWRQNRLQWSNKTNNTSRKPSRLELHTSSDVTDVPHAQPVPLSSKRIDEGEIWTAGATEDHTLRERHRQSCVKAWFYSILLFVRRRYATIFISLEWIRLGLFPRMSQIFTCLSAEDVTRQPRIWLLKSIPTAEVTPGSHLIWSLRKHYSFC